MGRAARRVERALMGRRDSVTRPYDLDALAREAER
jgi:hypothetical protein